MYLEHLSIRNFRCISSYEDDLVPGKILLVGDNASGKTSLLESIFYLVTGRSFRTRVDAECNSWAAAPGYSPLIQGRVRRAVGDSCALSVSLSAAGKSVRVDEQPIARLADLWGRMNAVLFTPDDLSLIKGGPGVRRRYLDVGLSQISPAFLFHLQRYGQALRQRNALLRSAKGLDTHAVEHEVEAWNEQLVEHGLPIFQMRAEFIAALQPRTAEFYAQIAGDDQNHETLALRYVNFLRREDPTIDDEARGMYRLMLKRSLSEDLRRGQTSIGLHRDDLILTLDGKEARVFASQGQVRSCVLALRLAEVQEMQERTGHSPLVLLDDLASELDPLRKKRLLELLDPSWQTFMTTTRREDFPADLEFTQIIELPLPADGTETDGD